MPTTSVITQEFQAIQAALEVLEPLGPTQRQFAVSMILSRLGMDAAPGAAFKAGSNPQTQAGAGGAAATGLNGISTKEFLKQKAPKTDLERLVCLAYYRTHMQDTPNFTTREITNLNVEAHGTDFSNAAATAMNAVRQSKLLSTAAGGKKRINTRGEALVEALPDRAKAKEALTASRGGGKKRGRAKKGKAAK
ncbi:MAG: hypothetical protein WBD67_08375 [Terracidiphilus sp.]